MTKFWTIGCEWKWHLQRPIYALRRHFSFPLASVWNRRQRLEQLPWPMTCKCTRRMAKQQSPVTYQPATASPDLLIREKHISIFLSLCIWCACCYSCPIFILTNTSSFSCSKHKALTPNVINPMKPGHYSTGNGLIPTCLCLLVLKISEWCLSFNALSHCTRSSSLE